MFFAQKPNTLKHRYNEQVRQTLFVHYIKCTMLSKSSKRELGYVHYIAKFTISRFVVLRFKVNLFTISWFECIFKNSSFFKDFDTFRWKNFYIRRINNYIFFFAVLPQITSSGSKNSQNRISLTFLLCLLLFVLGHHRDRHWET